MIVSGLELETVSTLFLARVAYPLLGRFVTPHQGRNMNGRTPAKAFADGLPKTTTKKEENKPARKAA